MTTQISASIDVDNAGVFVSVTGATGIAGAVVRVEASGAKTPIRNADPAAWISGAFSGYDYEAPLDSAVKYQVTDASDFNTVAATSPSVTVPSMGRTWLKHPGQPALNQRVTFSDISELVHDLPQGVFRPIGSEYPVVTSSRRWKPSGTVSLLTQTYEQRDAMLNLLSDGSTLLLQFPGRSGLGSQYVAVGSVSQSIPDPASPVRAWSLPINIVQAPVGLASAGAGNSWNDVIATYATWNDVMTAKATWNDLIRHVQPD